MPASTEKPSTRAFFHFIYGILYSSLFNTCMLTFILEQAFTFHIPSEILRLHSMFCICFIIYAYFINSDWPLSPSALCQRQQFGVFPSSHRDGAYCQNISGHSSKEGLGGRPRSLDTVQELAASLEPHGSQPLSYSNS